MLSSTSRGIYSKARGYPARSAGVPVEMAFPVTASPSVSANEDAHVGLLFIRGTNIILCHTYSGEPGNCGGKQRERYQDRDFSFFFCSDAEV